MPRIIWQWLAAHVIPGKRPERLKNSFVFCQPFIFLTQLEAFEITIVGPDTLVIVSVLERSPFAVQRPQTHPNRRHY